MSLLTVRDLRVGFQTDTALLMAVDGLSFDLAAGKTLGIVGESGCGKSVTARAIMRLLEQPSGRILAGQVEFGGQDLAQAPIEHMRKVRGKEIAMIFQEPMTALNPVHRVGKQIIENLMIHHPEMKPNDALNRAVELMQWVGIPAPDQRVNEYPHQLSGGMRQRVMIAMALSCNPKVLIADEPTTALDVTVQAQILDLLKRLQRDNGMGVILITHDLGVIAETCDEVVVMYAGRVVERASVQELFANPRHAYTRGLLASIPRLDSQPKTPLKTIPGSVPSIATFKPGCRFADRSGLPHSAEQLTQRSPFTEVSPGHWVEACPVCMGIEIAKSESNQYHQTHDNECNASKESALESALRFLRASEGTVGQTPNSESRASQRKAEFAILTEWAKTRGRLIPQDRYLVPFTMGAEHRIYFDETRNLAIKVTNTGLSGIAYPDGEPSAALLSEYLERWIRQNQEFGDCAEIEGIIQSEAGCSMVISQPWITGDVPTEAAIVNFMRDNGFEPSALPESYYSADRDLAAMDCHDGNFVQTPSGEVVPIDVVLIQPDAGLKMKMGLALGSTETDL